MIISLINYDKTLESVESDNLASHIKEICIKKINETIHVRINKDKLSIVRNVPSANSI